MENSKKFILIESNINNKPVIEVTEQYKELLDRTLRSFLSDPEVAEDKQLLLDIIDEHFDNPEALLIELNRSNLCSNPLLKTAVLLRLVNMGFNLFYGNTLFVINKYFVNISDNSSIYNLVERIRVPSNIKRIESEAFASLECLKEVDLSECTELYAIGDAAFQSCLELKSIDLSNTKVEVIPYKCFAHCQELEQADLTNVIEISSSAFANCFNLEEVIAPEAEYIYADAFRNCSRLRKVLINKEYLEDSGHDFSKMFPSCHSSPVVDVYAVNPNYGDIEEKLQESLFLDHCKNRNINFKINDNELIFDNYRDMLKAVQLLFDMKIPYSQKSKSVVIDKSYLQEKALKENVVDEKKIEDFINKEWADNILSKPVEGPSYINRDGKFIYIIGIADDMGEDNYPEDFPCHGALQTILQSNGLCNSSGKYDDGSPILRDMGYIRLNDIEADNNYIELSDKKPTEEQYEALEKWIDENQRHWRYIAVCTPKMIEYKKYDYKDHTTDEIIYNIRRYYATGELVEKIVKKGSKWQVQSEKGKNMGTYDTKKEAEKRLQQVHYFKHMNESYEDKEFKLGTAGFIKEDGTFIYADESEDFIHGEVSKEILDKGYPEFSNTHPEDDTCVRIYKEPNEIQYKKLEEIIDTYLDMEDYCKVEIWRNNTPDFYKIFTLHEGACDYVWEQESGIEGNWTGYKLVQIIKNHIRNRLDESLLLEKSRSQLINKSKASDNYSPKNQDKGRNRWERRNHSRIATRVDQYNKIDMNSFFKQDELKVGINIHGETNDYVVLIRYNGVLREIQQQVKLNKNKFEFKCVLIALQKVFNSDDVFVSCTCPDWRYRQSYSATKDGYNSGPAELRPSDITNPQDTKGGGCKHVNLVIGNVDWIMKVASVINNYVHYMEENMQRQYADLIFPKIFGIPYQKAVQLNLFDTGDDMETDEDTIALSNKYGRERTRFRKDVQINNQRNWHKPEQIIKPENPSQPLLKLNLGKTQEEIKDNIDETK